MSNSENIVCFFSFGYSHIFYEKLIQNKAFNDLMDSPNIIFIAPNRTHKSFFEKNNFEVFYLNDKILNKENNFIRSNNYFISAQKKSIINLSARKQENIYYEMDEFIHSVFSTKGVTHLIFSQPIEGLAGILLSENAKKLNIECFVPHSCRFLNNSFFNENQFEEISLKTKEISKQSKQRAKEIIESIRLKKQIQKYPYKSIIRTSFIIRVYKYLKKIILFEKIDLPRLKVSIENNFSLLFRAKYYFKEISSKKYFDIKSLNQIHEKIIFYPLQYTPESSINIPNSFFVDQNRLIDLIRFNMPENYLLLLKENPSMKGRRKINFYKNISKKSGVRLVSTELNTFDIISRANLVVSVSGTACLEAFILRRPSIVFGKTFFEIITNQFGIDYNNLKKTIKKYLDLKIQDIEIENKIALIIENTSEFRCGAVDMDADLISESNINEFVKALSSQMKRSF